MYLITSINIDRTNRKVCFQMCNLFSGHLRTGYIHDMSDFIPSDSIITFVRHHRYLHSDIATSCIVEDHASYMQMSRST